MLGEVKQGERILWNHMEDGRYTYPSSRTRLMQSLCLIYWPESEMQKLQQAELQRLQALAEVNPNIRQAEIDYLLAETSELQQFINAAQIKLEALRVAVIID